MLSEISPNAEKIKLLVQNVLITLVDIFIENILLYPTHAAYIEVFALSKIILYTPCKVTNVLTTPLLIVLIRLLR